MTIHESIGKFKQQLDQWDADIVRWESRAREMGAQINDEWKREIDTLRSRSEEARRRFQEMEHAADAVASDVRDAFDLAWNALKMGVYAVRSEFETQASGGGASNDGAVSPPVSEKTPATTPD